ncbi:nuclear transport factor 2 family protein [Robiginitalea sp. IMCC43444]|uniref:nuclear transport factor 2 family protein n=1 Tax=Robiginitalea sp. IMCC43444 TaxID=3459121 RepID=UPI0040433292
MKTLNFLAILLISTASLLAQTNDSQNDKAAVRLAITDYMEALYKVEPYKIERSVHPSLRKIGYWYNQQEDAYRNNLEMTYQQLYDLAGRWNADGTKVNADSPREIKIYEVHDKTATAKLTAEWGIDIFHLAKVEGQWKIYNIIWQSPPK